MGRVGGGPTRFRSVEYGPNGGELGFDVRGGSLIVGYRTRTNALDETPELSAAAGGLVVISEHVTLGQAGEEDARLEESVVERVASVVPAVPVADALDAVMVWPVPDEAGLYLVGFDTGQRRFIYAAGFRGPPSALS